MTLRHIANRVWSKRPLFRAYQTRKLSPGEQLIHSKLEKELNPESLDVADISGGCGSMFQIQVTSAEFEGLSTIQQHRLVNEILKDEVKQMHGLTLRTFKPQAK